MFSQRGIFFSLECGGGAEGTVGIVVGAGALLPWWAATASGSCCTVILHVLGQGYKSKAVNSRNTDACCLIEHTIDEDGRDERRGKRGPRLQFTGCFSVAAHVMHVCSGQGIYKESLAGKEQSMS